MTRSVVTRLRSSTIEPRPRTNFPRIGPWDVCPETTISRVRIERLTWAFLALGLVTRLVRYLVVYPIWHDEAFVAVNFLNRDYLDLLRPLDYYQVCPALFLAIELTVVKLLGFSEAALRLFPTLCSLASVPLFLYLASRLVRGLPLLLAMAIFATAFYPIRHGAEVKPYASDLFVALLILTFAVEWWRAPAQSRWWWLLAALMPVMLTLSYPAVFVAGGVTAALGPAALASRRRSVRLAYLVHATVLVASFIAVYFAFTVIQSDALRASYRWGYWAESFPPIAEFWRLPAWFVGVHTGNTMAYPVGGERGASTGTLIAVLLGVAALCRRNRGQVAALLLAPFLLGLIAAAMGRYPYGGAPRITQYLVPSICILAGAGGSAALSWLPSTIARRRGLRAAISMLAALGIYLAGRDLIEPYRVPSDEASRAFARQFWNPRDETAELLCVRSDLGFTFQPSLWKTGMSAVYRFHRGASGRPDETGSAAERLALAPPRHRVRLVFFDEIPTEDEAFLTWLNRLRKNYRISAPTRHVVSEGKPGESWLRERYVTLDLDPIPSGHRRDGEVERASGAMGERTIR